MSRTRSADPMHQVALGDFIESITPNPGSGVLFSSNNPSDAYSKAIEAVFQERYSPNSNVIPFTRRDLEKACACHSIKNIGDVLYTFRSRQQLPESIRITANNGYYWVIEFTGKGKYQFAQWSICHILPNKLLEPIAVHDCTPSPVSECLAADEQGMLARMRHNGILDMFLGIKTTHLQSHLRTSIPGVGQIEIDDMYVGVNSKDQRVIIPVQAKSQHDLVSAVQSAQDIRYCAQVHPAHICRAVAAKALEPRVVALFELEEQRPGHISVLNEQHFRFIQQPHQQKDVEQLIVVRKDGREGPK